MNCLISLLKFFAEFWFAWSQFWIASRVKPAHCSCWKSLLYFVVENQLLYLVVEHHVVHNLTLSINGSGFVALQMDDQANHWSQSRNERSVWNKRTHKTICKSNLASSKPCDWLLCRPVVGLLLMALPECCHCYLSEGRAWVWHELRTSTNSAAMLMSCKMSPKMSPYLRRWALQIWES